MHSKNGTDHVKLDRKVKVSAHDIKEKFIISKRNIIVQICTDRKFVDCRKLEISQGRLAAPRFLDLKSR
jgi:hypothetical protein